MCVLPCPISSKGSQNAPIPGTLPRPKSCFNYFEGFVHWFRIGYSGDRSATVSRNLLSVRRHPDVARKKLWKEIQMGRIAGPFVSPPLANLRVPPIGVVPKSSGSFRLIHHLLWPPGNSVNDGISDEACYVKYASFDEAVQCITRSGRSTLMAKTDVKSAFRLLPVNPKDFDLLGLQMDGFFLVEKCMAMGASSAPALFETFSIFLEWAIKEKAQCDRVVHYADDFMVYGLSGKGLESCHWVLETLIGVCKDFGVPLLVSSVRQSPPGRAFLRRIINLTLKLKSPSHRVRITVEARKDFLMWKEFLAKCNGSAIIPEQVWQDNADIQLFTDASGSQGFGGYFQGSWFRGGWPNHVSELSPSITWMEFFPIVAAVSVWGKELAGKKVVFRSDNRGVVAIINKQTSPCPDIMRLVRHYVLLCMEWDISFR